MDIPYGHRNKIMKRIKNKNSDGTRPVTNNQYDELPPNEEDVYDEEKQRRLFQEAVEAFRGNKNQDNYEKFVSFNENL